MFAHHRHASKGRWWPAFSGILILSPLINLRKVFRVGLPLTKPTGSMDELFTFKRDFLCLAALWSPAGKSWPLGASVCDVFLCFCHFPIRCPGSGVVGLLDCNDSWFLLSSLLFYSHEYRLTRNTVNCAILSGQIVVGCPLDVTVPISYYIQ